MDFRTIRIRDGQFSVLDRDPAQNYTDVTHMFAYLDDLRLRRDAIILDVGANIGIFSLSYAWLYDHATIHAFEPHPGTYETLAANVQLNADLRRRIQPHNVGFSNRNATAVLSLPSAEQHARYDSTKNHVNSGLFSTQGAGVDAVLCTFLAMDSAASDLPRVDFIKIDVEGHEFEVLEGGAGTINRWRPVVTLEYNELTRTLSRHGASDFDQFFRQRGYLVYGLMYGWRRKLKRLQDLQSVDDISDLVCVPDDRLEGTTCA